MTQREKTLTALVAGAGLLWFGMQGVERYRTARTRNVGLQAAAEQSLAEANAMVLRGQRARVQLHKWLEQSLPSDHEIAKSLYQDWLREQLTGAGLNVTQLADKSGVGRSTQQGELTVDVTAEGNLGQLVDFLYRFYTAVHLHRISGATITAADGGEKLTAVLTVGALILPESKQADKLAEGEPLPLPMPFEEFKTRLVSRNLFAAPKPKGQEGNDEAAAGAELSWMDYGSRGRRLGIRDKEGKLKYFYVGDEVEFGRFKGKVVELDNRRAIFQTDKGKMEVRLGQKLSEAVVIDSPAA